MALHPWLVILVHKALCPYDRINHALEASLLLLQCHAISKTLFGASMSHNIMPMACHSNVEGIVTPYTMQ